MEIIRCGREKFDPLIEIDAINKLRNDGRDVCVASASSCAGPSAEEKQLDEANWVVFQANLNRDQKHVESTKQLMMLYDRRTLSALVWFYQEPTSCSHVLVASAARAWTSFSTYAGQRALRFHYAVASPQYSEWLEFVRRWWSCSCLPWKAMLMSDASPQDLRTHGF